MAAFVERDFEHMGSTWRLSVEPLENAWQWRVCLLDADGWPEPVVEHTIFDGLYRENASQQADRYLAEAEEWVQVHWTYMVQHHRKGKA